MRDDLSKFFKALEKYYNAYINDPQNATVGIVDQSVIREKENALLSKKKNKPPKKDDSGYFMKLIDKYRDKYIKQPFTI